MQQTIFPIFRISKVREAPTTAANQREQVHRPQLQNHTATTAAQCGIPDATIRFLFLTWCVPALQACTFLCFSSKILISNPTTSGLPMNLSKAINNYAKSCKMCNHVVPLPIGLGTCDASDCTSFTFPYGSGNKGTVQGL